MFTCSPARLVLPKAVCQCLTLCDEAVCVCVCVCTLGGEACVCVCVLANGVAGRCTATMEPPARLSAPAQTCALLWGNLTLPR